MSYFKADELREYYHQALRTGRLHKSMEYMFSEAATYVDGESYDVFLSHSIKDKNVIHGVRQMYLDQGKTVYVDWIDDPEMDRAAVSAETAATLRRRMQACGSLVYVASDNAKTSMWMSWEIGYFDGLKGGNISIMPVEESGSGKFAGQEYLELYPVVQKIRYGNDIVAGVRKRLPSGQPGLESLGRFLGTGRPANTNFVKKAM